MGRRPIGETAMTPAERQRRRRERLRDTDDGATFGIATGGARKVGSTFKATFKMESRYVTWLDETTLLTDAGEFAEILSVDRGGQTQVLNCRLLNRDTGDVTVLGRLVAALMAEVKRLHLEREEQAAERERLVAQSRQLQSRVRKAEAPEALSLSAKRKLEAAIEREKRRLAAEFDGAVQAEIKRLIDEKVLPEYRKEMADAREIIEARKGVMPREVYRQILACLHPDRVPDAVLKERYTKAFNAFSSFELVLVSEKEMPTTAPAIPRSWDEMMKRREEMKARRKRKRSNATPNGVQPR